MFCEEFFALGNTTFVRVFKLDPPIRFEFSQGYLQKVLATRIIEFSSSTYTWFDGTPIGMDDMAGVMP